MWLVVGLGNYELKYAITRHNVGFLVLQKIISDNFFGLRSFKSSNPVYEVIKSNNYSQTDSSIFNKKFTSLTNKYPALVSEARLFDKKVVFCFHRTHMNNCGHSIKILMNHYKVAIDKLIVVHDDLDQLPIKVKAKSKGGSGGHNGINSLINCLGNQNFHRIKVGIGKPRLIIEWQSRFCQSFSNTHSNHCKASNNSKNVNNSFNADDKRYVQELINQFKLKNIDDLAKISVTNWVLSPLTSYELEKLASEVIEQVILRIKFIIK